ncbi:MAG: thioredoxin family protein [Deltaproteobacteria bacterium]|nr:thioredoxin family protein [Deltaproteobacteria bacterium]
MAKRKVEIFSAGCPLCDDVAAKVKDLSCSSCEITINNLDKGQGVTEARAYGVTSVPAVVVDGKLIGCRCGAISEDDLKAAGIGQPI